MAFSSIDQLSEELHSLSQGEPRTPVLKRFFKDGKRDGRRKRRPESVRQFLIDAVELATSQISEGYLDQERTLLMRLESLEAERQALEDSPPPSPLHSEIDPNNDGTQSPDYPLAHSVRRLEEKRRAAADQKAAREALERAERADQVGQDIAQTRRESELLLESFQQEVESAHHAGELLWDRYCSGYERGLSRRRQADDLEAGPAPDISFPMPFALRREEKTS